MKTLRVAAAQLDLVVGDLAGNETRIADAMDRAEEARADVLLLPELAVTGYPPEDLVLRRDFVDENLAVVRRLAERSADVLTVVGFVDRVDGGRAVRRIDDAVPRAVANAAALLHRGAIRGVYHKILLPNYGVFDEDRYFVPGTHPDAVWGIGEVAAGVSICEDIWVPDGPPARQARAGAEILLNINASPYHHGKAQERADMLAERAREATVPVVYLNLVGGQDELVFDGASMVVLPDGTVLAQAPQFAEAFVVVDVPIEDRPPTAAVTVVRADPLPQGRAPVEAPVEPLLAPPEAEIHAALVTGLRDYVQKNGFEGVVIGLSGGIDSSFTAVVAADALGSERVWGVAMPSRFNSAASLEDARALAEALGIRFDVLGIDPMFDAYLGVLGPLFEGTAFGTAEENMQARIRGALLMALSNKFGPMVVATGNKSEMAVGYATLYGDMVGGYAVLKDVYKTMLYRVARWRNERHPVIPERVFTKPPSAELRPNQTDQDTLPPYEVLDRILVRYVDQDRSVADIVAEGFDPDTVLAVARMVDRNEYKRRQAPPGVKITVKAFGKDRRLPITNAYRPHLPDVP